MLRKATLLAVGLVIGVSGVASAQSSGKLALLIPDLYGPNGLRVDSAALLPNGDTHSAHYNSAFQAEFAPFNIALASQLAALPLPSPASGLTYSFDSALGVFQRSTQSFGPILAERSETIGRGKLTFAVTYQHFSFDSIEGLDLGSIPALFTHDSYELGGGRRDVVTTSNAIMANVDQAVGFFSYGITDRLDVSLAVPIVRVDMSVTSDATIQRIGTATSPATHYYDDGTAACSLANISFASPTQCTTRRYVSAGNASGLGDVILRLKGTALRGDKVGLALGVDVRLPTGDEENFLGLGTTGVKPFMALSFGVGRMSPHLNLAYLWNGKSVLAGNVATGEKADMPDQLSYAAGLDVGATKWLTIAADFLGVHVIDAPRLFPTTFAVAGGPTFPQIAFRTDSYDTANGAVGIKINPGGKLLLDFNVLFKLNDAGLRDKVTPLAGLEYTF
jgi:hypothetical protein